jgi:hypothetical protein
MIAWRRPLILLLLCGQVFAQEQMAVRLNENGILKILKMAIKYNAATRGGQTVIIPQNTYKFTIPKAELESNPIIPIVNEISDLNLNNDLTFYLNTSQIKIEGKVDLKSLKASIFNSHDNGFDLRLTISLPQITMNGAMLSLCEDKHRYNNTCGDGLKATLNQLHITTASRPVVLTAVLRMRTDGKVARVSVRSVDSNLEGETSPDLDINFDSIDIPRIAIVIDGQETELNTSELRNEILNRKTFLGKKLLSFAGDYIANDVAEMINVYLINKKIATSYQVYRKDQPVAFNEFIREQNFFPADKTYVRKHVIPLEFMQKDPMNSVMEQISDVIKNAQVDIALKKITTPKNKDVELAGILNFILNGKKIKVRNTLGNSNRPLPALNLAANRNHDINLAISEPLINGALDVANSTNLFQEIFEMISPVKGVSIRSVKLHFHGNTSLVAVINARIDLRKIEAENVRSWFENKIGAWLERNNNNSIIYFPIEVAVIPDFKKLANGGTGLDLRVLSPFDSISLPNRFNYPSNVPDMKDVVKNAVMSKLKIHLEPYFNRTYPNVDLSKYLNQAGVEFLPKSITINQGAYLLMNLDLVDIKFDSKNPNKR